jgi:predicted Rdx family selenoprotein
MQRTTRIDIEYCTQRRWLLRALWMAKEQIDALTKPNPHCKSVRCQAARVAESR